MRYSKLFGKTVKSVPKDAAFKSHQLLYKGGYIRESVAGRFFFLPLGMRVQDKVMKVVEEEMDRAGAQKMISPTLHPLELWKETNRTNTTGFELLKVRDRRGAEFALGGTAEEMFVDVVRKFNLSYKDLPINLYQFSNKFRDEMRARGGLLRVREFVMKDAYSFHTTEEDFKKEYQSMADTYTKIFDRLGLKTVQVLSDNGYIGGEYCHEFVVESEIGETKYLETEDGKYRASEDVAEFKREEVNMDEEMKEMEVIEQPEWVQTMEDNEKHYGFPKSRYLKNVVYRNRTNGEIIIAVMPGNLEASKVKLEHVVDAVGQLEDATDEDLEKIGTKSGYVHCWGHKGARYIGDISLKSVRNFIGGQKEEKTDTINVNYGRDFECETLADIAVAKDGYLYTDGKTKLVEKRGIEVGNIFQLGYHYSSRMNATFVDSDGKEKQYYMGCYGIGLGRTLAAIAEIHNDEKGLIWPEIVAPYKVHIVSLEGVDKEAEELYNSLTEKGIEVLWDDRDGVSAGEKFADADLLGIPTRIVVSEKSLKAGGYEVKERRADKKDLEINSKDDFIKRFSL
jgi:prolyl-tRNA synthetase